MGGSVINEGTIGGKFAIRLSENLAVVSNNAGYVTNYGTIVGSTKSVELDEGGTVTNSGLISGEVEAEAGSSVIDNLAGGTIESTTIGVDTLGTIIDAGVISGSSYSVKVDAGGGLLKLYAGAVLDGEASGGSEATLELAAGGAGTISGFSSEFIGFPTLDVDSGATWTIGSTGETIPVAIANAGQLTFDETGTLVLSGSISGSGGLLADGPGTLSLTASDSFTGGSIIEDGVFDLAAQNAGGGGAITFTPLNGATTDQLKLETAAQVQNGTFTDTLDDFVGSATLDLANLAYTGVGITPLSVETTNGNASITVDESGTSETFDLLNAAALYYATSDNAGGTLISTVACYCSGTAILTDRGEIGVESLAIGDLVVTASGERRPIKWIGVRAYSVRFARNNAAIYPVCFKAGSLGGNTPIRDLWVSPKHAMFLEGSLIPAESLVNGVSIVQPVPRDKVRYYHIELDTHDVLIANGAASESFVDDDSRGMFHNAASYELRYPRGCLREVEYCAPRVCDGELLERVRRRLNGPEVFSIPNALTG